MPALDACHPQVITALQKDGWRIIGQNERLYLDGRMAFVDVKAVRGTNGN
jgi:hypothetical protein